MMELQSDLDQCLPPGTEGQAPNDDIQITDCELSGLSPRQAFAHVRVIKWRVLGSDWVELG